MERLRIFVVDPHRDCADTFAAVLESEGFDARPFYSPHAALVAAHVSPPWAAVLDVEMPEMDGYELATALRMQIERAIHIIAVTGWHDDQRRQRCFDQGFEGYFLKPCEPKELIELLRECLTCDLQRRDADSPRAAA